MKSTKLFHCYSLLSYDCFECGALNQLQYDHRGLCASSGKTIVAMPDKEKGEFEVQCGQCGARRKIKHVPVEFKPPMMFALLNPERQKPSRVKKLKLARRRYARECKEKQQRYIESLKKESKSKRLKKKKRR